MGERVATATATDRFSTALLSTFGGLALALAAVGVYGVISFSVARRTREIGVRVALGAREGDVLKMVVKQGLGVALAGVATGAVIALLVTRLLRSQLHGVSPGDPIAFTGGVLLLVGVAAVASWVPARQAARSDPMEALRHE
jgi:putative ABC transport system permease protein